jgi:hypothetical protein
MYHGAATEESEDGMAEPIKVPYEETAESYVARIRELAGTDRVGGARRVLQEALQKFPDDPILARWKELLGPAKFNGYRPASGFDRSAELQWLDTFGPLYRGEWLAVLGDRLLGHSKDLQELTEQLKREPTERPPLYHYIPDTE